MQTFTLIFFDIQSTVTLSGYIKADNWPFGVGTGHVSYIHHVWLYSTFINMKTHTRSFWAHLTYIVLQPLQICIIMMLKLVSNIFTHVWVMCFKYVTHFRKLLGLFSKMKLYYLSFTSSVGASGPMFTARQSGRQKVLRDGLKHWCFWSFNGICWQ